MVGLLKGGSGSGDVAKEAVSELAADAAVRLNDFTTELGGPASAVSSVDLAA